MNETYRADTGVAKILYRQIRKHYKRYRYGRWLELAFLLLILGIDIGLFRKAKLPEQFPEVLALAVAVTILLCIPPAADPCSCHLRRIQYPANGQRILHLRQVPYDCLRSAKGRRMGRMDSSL